MTKKALALSWILVLSLMTGSCKKLETAGPTSGMVGPLAFEPTKYPDAIPSEYGTLTGVTQNPNGWIGLWFQRPDGTVTAVFVSVERGKMFERALRIPRK